MFSPEKFAYNIKFHRKRRGLTQKELAEKLAQISEAKVESVIRITDY